MRVAYDVYMGTSSVNDTHATITGTRALMYLIGRAPYPAPGALTVTVDAPPNWKLATGLDAVRPGVFTAPDYDTLVDAPIEASPELRNHHLRARQGAVRDRHPRAAQLRHRAAERRCPEDRRRGSAADGRRAVKRYVFFFHGTNGGSGGLEHLNSTSITFGRYAQDNKSAYQRFQFVIAHEFFHLWNVKRIRPEILGPFDYSRPQHTRNLYVSEGMTSYFAALALVRSGVWDRPTFYDDLATNIQELQTQPGHLVTSAEMSSWLTWNRQDNAANVTISYYTKGQILGTLLDLDMRARTGNKKSLDDVFRQLLAEHGLPKPGFAEDGGFRGAVEKTAASGAAKGDFGEFFQRYVSGLDELPYDSMLTAAGLKLEISRAPAARSIGAATRTDADRLVVDSVPPSGAAYDAGLMPNDVLLALDDERVVPGTFAARLNDRKAGAIAKLTVMRGDRFLTIPVTLEEERKPTYKIVEDPAATAAQRALRDAWLRP